MDLVQQLLKLLETAVEGTFGVVLLIWNWVIDQIQSVPWNNLGGLVWWKKILLAAIAGGVGWFIYKGGKEILDSGQKALASVSGLLGVFVKTLIPISLAGVVAAAGAWMINTIQF